MTDAAEGHWFEGIADHLGTSDQKLSLRPMWAFQLGRFRFASSGASALLYQGRETVDSGVSTVLALGGVQGVAALAGFLASPAAGYITGQVISVNGGLY